MPKDLIEYTKEAIFEFIKWDMNTVVENIIAHLKSYKEESGAKLEDRKDFVSKEAQMVVSRMKRGELREVWGRIDALIAHQDIAAFVNNYQPTKTERKVGEVKATGAYEELMKAEYNSLEDYESGSSQWNSKRKSGSRRRIGERSCLPSRRLSETGRCSALCHRFH